MKKWNSGKLLLTAAVALIIDMASKWFVAHMMFPNESRPLIGDFVRITLVRNTGSAFGFFSGQRTTLIVISVVAILLLGYLIVRSRERSYLSMISLGLVLGGALGNLVDRVRVGRVIDFLDVGFGRHRWPVFNFADACVTVGVAILAVSLYTGGEKAAGKRSEKESLS
ncbi:MAG: signal peptidase II [Candidatus Eisenbacteria bacterium]|nr:signal peptidase II [Candidatus Eisenbacteria bacterium]